MRRIPVLLFILLFLAATADVTQAFLSGCCPPPGTNWINVNVQPGIDECDKFNNAYLLSTTTQMPAILWPPGDYTAPSVQCVMSALPTQTVSNTSAMFYVEAAGVRLHVTGTQTSGMQINYQGNQSLGILHGLTIVIDNPTPLFGFDNRWTSHFMCDSCRVLMNTAAPNPGFAAVHIGSLNHDITKFSQGTRYENLMVTVYGQAGIPSNAIPTGVWIEGQQDNTMFSGGAIGNVQNTFLMTDDSQANAQCTANGTANYGPAPCCTGAGTGTCNNGALPGEIWVQNMDDESSANAFMKVNVVVPPTANAGWNGGHWSVTNNDLDNNHVVEDLTGMSLPGFVSPPYFAGNSITSSELQFVVNPNHAANPFFSLDTGAGSGVWPLRFAYGGLSADYLAASVAIQGSMVFQGLPAPIARPIPQCTVGGGENCNSSYCYKMNYVDWQGKPGQVGPEVCQAGSSPNTLTGTNFVLVGDAQFPTPTTGVCGWQIYGRPAPGVGGHQFLNPGGKLCGQTPVSLLTTDSQVVFGTGVSPQLKDDGSLVPLGVPPTGPGTSGQIIAPIQGFSSVLAPGYPVANLPTFHTQALNLPQAGVPLADYFMNEASGNLTDASGHGNTATAHVGAGAITYGVAGSITDDLDTAIGLSGAGNPYFSVAPVGTLPTGSTMCWTLAYKKNVTGTNMTMLTQKTLGMTVVIDAAKDQVTLVKDPVTTIALSQGAHTDTGVWHRVMLSLNAGVGTIWVDGVNETVRFNTVTLTPADGTLYMGVNSTLAAADFNGTLDEIGVYGSACTQADADADYRGWVKRKEGMSAAGTDSKCYFTWTNGAWRAGTCGLFTFANRPACNATLRGARGTVLDVNAASCTAAGFGVIPTGGGTVVCPATCDGSNWLLG